MSTATRTYHFDVDQYRRMVETGVIGEDDPVELLEGELVTKMGRNPPHLFTTSVLFRFLLTSVPSGWLVLKEDPIETADSVPEPDCALVRGKVHDYRQRLPTASETALVVEVADASLFDDQTRKKTIYARAGIPCYWIVNLPARVIEVYSDPTGPAPLPDYQTRTTHGETDEVPLILDGVEVARLAVRDVLP